MAVTVSTIADPLGSKLIIDSDANATSEANVATGASTLYAVEIDNTANTAAVYLKFLNSTSAATAGTTVPTHTMKAPGSTKLTYIIGTGILFDVGITFWCVISSAALSNTDSDAATGPTSDVSVKLLCT